MKIEWGNMTRPQFMWLTLYAAMIQALFFGLADCYFPAFLCVCYDLAIVLCELIRLERKDRREGV